MQEAPSSPGSASSSSQRRTYRAVRRLRAALLVLLVVLPLAVGGAHAPVNALLAALLLGGLAFVFARRPADRPLRLGPEGLAAVVALGATLLQCVPLPIFLWRLLSPSTHEILARAYESELALAPLTLDPPATHHEILKLVALAGAALLAGALFGRERRHGRVMKAVAFAGGAVLAAGFLHMVMGVAMPYGHFGPGRAELVSTFVNPNHLAGFLGFAAFVCAGVALMATDARRWIWALVSALFAAGVLLTLSRGAILAFVVTAAGGAVLIGLGRASRGRRTVVLAIQAGLLAGIAAVAYLGYTRLVHEMWTLGEARGLSKLGVWEPVPRLVADFPLFGVGRGAMSAVYPRYETWPGVLTFTHLESEPLQAIVDWGVLPGILLIGMAVWSWWRAWRAQRDPARRFALLGIAFLGVHNLMEFSFTLTGVALPVIVLLACFNGESDARPSFAVPRRLLAWSLAGLAPLTLFAAWSAIAHDVRRDTARLQQDLSGASPEAGIELANAAIRRHPSDFILPLTVAEWEIAQRGGARRAIHWINRSMWLAPDYAPSHRLAARALVRIGARQQALLEYRLACQADLLQAADVMREVISVTKRHESIVELAAGTDDLFREQAAWLLVQEGKWRLALDVLGRRPGDIPVRRPHATQLAGRCYATLGDYAAAAQEGRALQTIAPRNPHGYITEAQALVQQQRLEEAAAVLRRGLAENGELSLLLAHLATVLLTSRRLDEALLAGDRMLAASLDPQDVASAHQLLARIYAADGQRARALRELEKARDRVPDSLSFRLEVAKAREAIGDTPGALRELERAFADLGTSAQLETELLRLRGR